MTDPDSLDNFLKTAFPYKVVFGIVIFCCFCSILADHFLPMPMDVTLHSVMVPNNIVYVHVQAHIVRSMTVCIL